MEEAVCCPAWQQLAHIASHLLCRTALVLCLEMVTFWLSVLKLQFNSWICILDFHVLIFQLYSTCDILDTELKNIATMLLPSHYCSAISFSVSTIFAEDRR